MATRYWKNAGETVAKWRMSEGGSLEVFYTRDSWTNSMYESVDELMRKQHVIECDKHGNELRNVNAGAINEGYRSGPARYWKLVGDDEIKWKFSDGKMLVWMDGHWTCCNNFTGPEALFQWYGTRLVECDTHGIELPRASGPFDKPSHYRKDGMELHLIRQVFSYFDRVGDDISKEDIAKAVKYIDMLLSRMA